MGPGPVGDAMGPPRFLFASGPFVAALHDPLCAIIQTSDGQKPLGGGCRGKPAHGGGVAAVRLGGA